MSEQTIGQSRTESLRYESIEDALRACIESLGGLKRVAAWLYPDRELQAATYRMWKSLHPDMPERFTPEQIVRINQRAREVGCFALTEFLAARRPSRKERTRKRSGTCHRRAASKHRHKGHFVAWLKTDQWGHSVYLWSLS